jgi:hypothetical protein
LEGKISQLFHSLKVWIDRFLAAQIIVYQTNGQGLTAPWLAANKYRDSIDDARNDCEDVLFKSLIDSCTFLQVHTDNVIILLAINNVLNPLRCESCFFFLGIANNLQELLSRNLA